MSNIERAALEEERYIPWCPQAASLGSGLGKEMGEKVCRWKEVTGRLSYRKADLSWQ